MTHTYFTLQQNVYHAHHEPITVEDVDELNVSFPVLQCLINSAQGATVGVAATYRLDCTLSSLAFATLTKALVIHFFSANKQNLQPQKKKGSQEQQPQLSRGRILIQDEILRNSDIKLYGYRIDRIAIGLFLELSLRINAGVDILSVSNSGRRSFQAIMDALGGEILLQKSNLKTLFSHEDGGTATKDVALQAWAACRAATLDHMTLRYAALSRIATDIIPDGHLSALAKISRDAEILDSMKPREVVNHVKADFNHEKGKVNLECTRFSTRIMKSRNGDQVIQIETMVGDKRTMVTGRAKQIDGKQAHINIDGEVHASSKVLTVTTVGKGDLTAAESYKEDVVLKALQGTITLTEHPFFCSIWAPSLNVSWPSQDTSITPVIDYPDSKLNSSQSVAVERIISQSDTDRVLLIHGPPGTGKTTVIAASVNSMIKTGPKEGTIWLVAQSNVAVRNIAEKLDKVGFRDFKLLVSKDFHHDWHEGLYQSLEHCFIRSDLFGGSVVEISRLLLGARVILCTLSTLSNPNIDTITRIVSVQTVIFDEASQIEVGDYVPLLQRFQNSLKKMVFIGDDKQHRMPVVIGDFISDHVYNKKLKTKHDDTSKTACRFLDVKMGREESVGHSWINQKEISAVIGLARLYETQGKKFKILTPYDAQRTKIEEQLKSAKLLWEDKCFNVDSFQGNLFLNILEGSG
ncbi:hypothetical protein BDR05DRAFT_977761 [Suillus weaverae]|nr:hypothetical protein BDR05DRAFT_977761 [Suillus weaverae]